MHASCAAMMPACWAARHSPALHGAGHPKAATSGLARWTGSPVVCMHLWLAAGVLDLREVLVLNQASFDVALWG